ncbi:LVIVD repeat-containing protein [Winogradskyella sp. MIT101101]|uniref:LVIVD repeat-containing protein n=1 Tax=Winogradskyella sp. MIT101101 TaxID=3098297 RepID=UPI00399A947E
MRKIYTTIIIALVLLGCSSDSTSSNDANTFSETGQGGSLARFALYVDYLYVVDDSNLNVFSITDRENPVQVNTVPIGFNIETLFNYKNYLYMGSRNGMYIYNIDNPETPTYMSDVQHFTACDPVVANETHAFVTLHTNIGCGVNINVLEIYDVTEITNPVLVSSRNLTRPIGIGLYGDYLFVCDDEVKVFDVSNPEESELVTSLDVNSFDVIINNGILVLIGENGLYQYSLDSSDITNINHLSTIDI